MKRDIYKALLGGGVVAIVSRREGPRFMLERLAREIEAADAEDRRQVQALLDAKGLDTLPAARIESLLQALTETQARLLLKFAQAGRASSLGAGQTLQAERAAEVRAWVAANAPAARNVRELRALPGFPLTAQFLTDATVRKAAGAAGHVFAPGRSKKT